MLSQIVAYAGVLASVWLVLGVFVAGLRYEGYSHTKQFCSELGAAGSPTEKFSPLINNYPLGALFSLFGVYVMTSDSSSTIMVIVGVLIVMHGLGTWVAGYFPMDADPYTETPTFSCRVHSWAGFVMLFSLLIAPALSLFDDGLPLPFKAFTVACLLGAVLFMATLAKAFKEKGNPGIHQRLSYGAQLAWLSGLSITLA